MMDEKLTIFTLFCTLSLPTIIFKKLTSLTVVGKYNYSLLDLVMPVKVNSLRNKFCILVEVTRTYKTFICCFILSNIYICVFLRDRMICVMWHLVNYSYIALSLGVKVRRKIMKFAGNGATSLLEQSNNKVYIVLLLSIMQVLVWTEICWWGFLTPESLQLLVRAW